MPVAADTIGGASTIEVERLQGSKASSVAASTLVSVSVALVTAWVVGDLLWKGELVTGTRSIQFLAAALSCVASTRLIVIVMQKNFDFPRAAFYVFTLVWMCYAPLAQLAFQTVPITISFSPERYETGLVLVMIGILGYEGGVFFQGRREIKRVLSRGASSSWQLNIRRLQLVTVVGLIVVSILLAATGGFEILVSSRSEFSDAMFGSSSSSSKASGAIVNSLILVIPFVSAMGWMVVLVSRRQISANCRVLAFVTLVANVAVNNPVSQSRFWVATVYLSMLGCWLTPRFPQFPKIAVSLSLVFLIIVFPFSDIFRHAEGSREIKINDPLAQLASKGDFDAFPQLTSSIWHVANLGQRHGHQAAGAAAFFVPRALWSGKSEDTGTMLGKEANLGNVNLSAPLWAEGYVDFGVAGAFIYLFLLGRLSVVLGRLTSTIALGPGFACFVGVYQFVLLRGSLLQAMGISFVLAVLFRVIMTKNEPNESLNPELRFP